MPFSNCNHRLVYLRKWQIQKEIDITNFTSLSDNIDATLNFRSKVVSIETKQICWKIFSLAVDKRTKNNLCMHLSLSFYHLLFYQNLCFDRTDLWFRSKELSIETTFDRTNSIPFYSVGDICDLLDRVCRPRGWFVSDKPNLFSTVEYLWIQRNRWSTKYYLKMLL